MELIFQSSFQNNNSLLYHTHFSTMREKCLNAMTKLFFERMEATALSDPVVIQPTTEGTCIFLDVMGFVNQLKMNTI